MIIEFKTKKEFVKKVGILILGVPNGLFVGLLWYILMDDDLLQHFLKWKFLFVIIWFVIIGGIIFGYIWGNTLWNLYQKKVKKDLT